MEYLYLVCLLFAIGMMFWLKVFDVRKSITQFISLLIVAISNLGFYFISVSTDINEALLAQKISYVGGVFLPAFYFFMVLEVCHVELKRFVGILIISAQCAMYGLICTIGQNDLFYKSVSAYTENGFVFLEKDYGPFHVVTPLTMFVYLFAAIFVAIYCVIKKKSVDRKGLLVMIFLSATAVGIYIFEKTSHLKVEIMPIAFDILMMGALIPVYGSNLYTVYANTEIINEQLNKIGFLTFDTAKAYRGCNVFMEEVFPELTKFRVGEKIDGCSYELYHVVMQISTIECKYRNSSRKELKKSHLHTALEPFMKNEKYYTGVIHGVTNAFGKLKGYTIEIKDDTEHYEALALQENYNESLEEEVTEKTNKIRAIQQKTILGMARMVESRDLSTGGHIKRTSDVVRIFADRLLNADLGLSHRVLNLVIRSAPMHDLGKIGVPDAVLQKQGRFTPEEYDAMKKHSEIGYKMVREILADVEEPDFVEIAKNVAHYHHEKVNGTGYPSGLKGEEIPIEARIMALADVFDALVSKRCYKEAFSYDTAFEIIEKDSGTHFDEKLAKIFISCRQELEDYYNKSEE